MSITVNKVFSTKKANVIGCDVTINGVIIYGCFVSELQTKEGVTFHRVNFPSYKANNGKYYSHCYVKLEDKDTNKVWELARALLVSDTNE